MKMVFSLYRETLAALPPGGRRFFDFYSSLLAALSVFDAAALGLLALVIAPLSVGNPVTLPLIGELSPVGVMIALGAICALMIIKGLLAVLITWWATRRTARYELAIGDRLFRAYLRAPWVDRLKKNSSDVMRFTDAGVDATMNAFLRPGATLLGEAVNLVVVVATLAVITPAIALIALVYLLALGAVLYFWIARHARLAGQVNLDATIRTSRVILEVMSALKEITLRRREGDVAKLVEDSRRRSTRARANAYFLGQVPRYVLESGLIGGFLVVGLAGFLLGGQDQAVSAVALFGLAGFRLAPAIIRAQSIMSQMLAAASYPRRILDELAEAEQRGSEADVVSNAAMPAHPRAIEVTRLCFIYPGSAAPAVSDVDLSIPFGSFVAFVGASGSGKSTMVDLLLSLLSPTSGGIAVDGEPLHAVRDQWRAQVGYVPQDVALFDGTVGQNVALTWDDSYDRDRARRALELAQVWSIVAGRPGGLDSPVGERGLALSGGQRQRLGIARALYADPLVLVLDEATSALDAQTEAAVSESILELSGSRTLVVVAHRLSTIKRADTIFFMRDGRVVDHGTFAELVSRVPDFARQAELSGLA